MVDKMKPRMITEKQSEILFEISRKNGRKKNLTVISRKSNTTYSHTTHVADFLEKKGLIVSKKSGRCRHVEITLKGEEFCMLYKKLKKLW